MKYINLSYKLFNKYNNILLLKQFQILFESICIQLNIVKDLKKIYKYFDYKIVYMNV